MKVRPNNWNVLFIDDSKIEINYLKLFFQLSNVPLIPSFINYAPDAIKILGALKENEFPDIIIVDINMPLMDGFEFAEAYFNTFSKKYTNTRLFIYSTSIHSTDIRRAETTEGVSGFIAKPFSENTFTDFILPYLPVNMEVITK